jgi:CRP-like cAMP-binding protein
MKTIREKKLLCFKPFLDDIVEGKRPLRFKRKQRIYSQGDPADSVFFIEEGKAILTVVSSSGKEATLGVLHPGDFLGEGCLNEQPFRTHTATTWEPSLLVRIEKNALSQALHNNSTLAEAFIGQLLAHNIQFQEDLCAQLFNHSEKRLARLLLKLAHFGEKGSQPVKIAPKPSHEILAEMVGTTRSRVNYFMNKFKNSGLVHYDHGIVVHPRLLTEVILKD